MDLLEFINKFVGFVCTGALPKRSPVSSNPPHLPPDCLPKQPASSNRSVSRLPLEYDPSAEGAQEKGGNPELPLLYLMASKHAEIVARVTSCERKIDAERDERGGKGGKVVYLGISYLQDMDMRCYVASRRPRRRRVS